MPAVNSDQLYYFAEEKEVIDTWELQDHKAPTLKAYSSSFLNFLSNQPDV